MFSEEQLYSIALRRCAFVGDINFSRLVRAVGSAEDVWKSPKKILAKIDQIGVKTVSEIGSAEYLHFAEKELEFCEIHNVKIFLKHTGNYSNLLRECEDAPAILYQKGNIDENLLPVSIVGTRNLTAYGKIFISDLLSELKSQKVLTVSGLALGADMEVHTKSIENNIPTVAILAHGFQTLYPSKNKKLSEKILENGGSLITEFNTSQKPDRENFIQRNRIIAGLSPSTIIVETAFGGGSISTATFANNYNRNVFALPGKITDKYSQGCNNLIHQNKAATVSSISQLIEDLGFNSNQMSELFPKEFEIANLTEEQQKVFKLIKSNPNINLDEIANQIEIPIFKLSSILIELELMNLVKTFSGKQFQTLV